MGVRERYTRSRTFLVERPGAVVVGVLVVVLLFDLVLRLVDGRLGVSALSTFLWHGVVQGLAIGLAGIGLSMTYSILRFANFAHGDYIAAGAFSGWVVTYVVAGAGGAVALGDLVLLGVTGGANASQVGVTIVRTPVAVLAGLLLAAVGTIVITLVLDRIVFRPMRDQGGITLLIASIGVALALRYLLAFVFGTANSGVTAGNGPTWAIESLGLRVTAHELTLVVAAVLLMAAVHFLLQRTKLGKAMRAMADNRDLALVTGIPTERVVRATWVIGGGLAGAAGYLLVLERGTLAFDFGWILLLLIFAAVILGGIGSVYGAMLGGLTIGIAERLALIWIPSDFTTAVAFGVMIVILLVKPEGLFSGVTTA